MKKYLLAGLCLIFLSASAQKGSDKGIIYYTLGNDTTIIQYYEYHTNHFKSTWVQFTGSITKCEAEGTLTGEGDLFEIKSTNYQFASDGNWTMTTKGENKFTGDSSVYIAVNPRGAVANRRSYPGKGIVANGMDIASFYLFPFMGFYAPAKNGDTLFHRQLSIINIRPFAVTRKSKEEVRIGSSLMGYLSLFLDDKNRLSKLEGVGSSLNIRGSIERHNTDVTIIDNIAKRRNAAGTAAVRTLRDTAHVVLNDNIIEVDYWAPHKRGREIFGNVVPWNKAWRTGANNATQLRFTKDIIIGGSKLAAGKYGIWSYPTETSWELLINKNATNWGTDYDATGDILKLPLKVERLAVPVEVLKISLIKKDNNSATLTIEWDTYKGSIDIKSE